MSHNTWHEPFDVEVMQLAEMSLEELAIVLPALQREGEARGFVGVLTQHRLDRAHARLQTA